MITHKHPTLEELQTWYEDYHGKPPTMEDLTAHLGPFSPRKPAPILPDSQPEVHFPIAAPCPPKTSLNAQEYADLAQHYPGYLSLRQIAETAGLTLTAVNQHRKRGIGGLYGVDVTGGLSSHFPRFLVHPDIAAQYIAYIKTHGVITRWTNR